MIQKLSIRNYKSLKSVDLDCKKLNVFIGEPNSGKSNIIEALSLMSAGVIGNEVSKDIIRYKNISDLFYDFDITASIEVVTDQIRYSLEYPMRESGVPDNIFYFKLINVPNYHSDIPVISINHHGKILTNVERAANSFRFYEYKRLSNFTIGYTPYLSVPYGNNLPALLLSNKDYRSWVSDFFQSKGFKLTLKPAENEINMSKIIDDEIYSYPYHAISETLQRVVFYMLAIKSNKDAVLLFDEPDSNTFPFYTGFMGERIALDETNQFFLTTHNPYLLFGLIEKSKKEDINVCVVTMKDYETKVTVLNEAQVGEVLNLNVDVFLNLDRIID